MSLFKEPMQPRDELVLVPSQKCMTVLCCTLLKAHLHLHVPALTPGP